MSFDWLKSVSAQIGVEGRNTVIVSALLFCGFGLWVFASTFTNHPLLSWVFLIALFLLAVTTILIGLLAKPQPSEIAEKFLLQQIGQQVFYAGGFQSPTDLIELLRAAHNIQDLPPPSAVVGGSAANEAHHRQLSAAEAEEIARKDREGVREMIRTEADKIQSSLGIAQVAGGTPKQLLGPKQTDSKAP